MVAIVKSTLLLVLYFLFSFLLRFGFSSSQMWSSVRALVFVV